MSLSGTPQRTVLLAHRCPLVPGATIKVFLTNAGTFPQSASLSNAFKAVVKEAGIAKHVHPHGLRYCSNDVLRRAGVDPVSARAITGHVTQEMQQHYSTVALDEKRDVMARVAERLQAAKEHVQVDFLVDLSSGKKKAASPGQEKAA